MQKKSDVLKEILKKFIYEIYIYIYIQSEEVYSSMIINDPIIKKKLILILKK